VRLLCSTVTQGGLKTSPYPSTTPEPCQFTIYPSCCVASCSLFGAVCGTCLLPAGGTTTRFANWFFEKRAFDRRGSAITLDLGSNPFLHFVYLAPQSCGSGGAGSYCFPEDPCKVGKLTLKMTERATWIYRTALVVYTLIVLLAGVGL